MRSLAILRLWNIEASAAALLIELNSDIVAAFADISIWSSETTLNSPTLLLVFHDLSTFAVERRNTIYYRASNNLDQPTACTRLSLVVRGAVHFLGRNRNDGLCIRSPIRQC